MSNPANLTHVPPVRLLGRWSAPQDLYVEVGRQARGRIPDLRFGVEYKAEDLVDPDLWGDNKQFHQLIGRCVAHLVVSGRLALRFAGCPRCNNKRYLRI